MSKIRYLIIEEVPGVPEDERWYVTNDGGADFRIEQYKAFSTQESARAYFHSFGIPDSDIHVEGFMP